LYYRTALVYGYLLLNVSDLQCGIERGALPYLKFNVRNVLGLESSRGDGNRIVSDRQIGDGIFAAAARGSRSNQAGRETLYSNFRAPDETTGRVGNDSFKSCSGNLRATDSGTDTAQ
jgi:hypothetical protein